MDYNDYELISYIRDNNEEASNILIKKYEPLIISIAKRIFNSSSYNGLEINDLVQEGMVALEHAVNHYDEMRDITFYTFAKTCIERRLISVIVASKRQKHKVLNESLSFESEDGTIFDSFLKDENSNPENIIVNSENVNKLICHIKENLTDFEQEVFDLMLSSFNYREIANILGVDLKKIDNAIQRIRKKARRQINLYSSRD